MGRGVRKLVGEGLGVDNLQKNKGFYNLARDRLLARAEIAAERFKETKTFEFPTWQWYKAFCVSTMRGRMQRISAGWEAGETICNSWGNRNRTIRKSCTGYATRPPACFHRSNWILSSSGKE